jgi:TPR repeat protein
MRLGELFDVIGDKQEAAKWYRLAVEQNNAEAMFNLATLLEDGELGEDKPGAAKLYKQAAKKGFTNAQINYANMCNNGWGIPVDKAKAVKYYKKAAEQGDPEGLHHIGTLLYDGDVVPKDLLTATRYENGRPKRVTWTLCLIWRWCWRQGRDSNGISPRLSNGTRGVRCRRNCCRGHYSFTRKRCT